MTENSVIKHYKKQLIYRQHDMPDQNLEEKDIQVKIIDNNKIYDFVETDTKNESKPNANNGKKVRKKRKNKNCRGQFRHEGMELIKLGTNTSHSLCKTKEPYNMRVDKEKPQPEKAAKEEQNHQNKADNTKESNKQSVIQTSYPDKTIILENPPVKSAIYGHALPQMVPERRNSKEYVTPKVPAVPYGSPTRPFAPQPEYRVPIHPVPYIPLPGYPHPLPHNLPLRPYARVPSPHLLPPPPYTLPRSPPRPVPRSPMRSIPQSPLQAHRPPSFPKSPIDPPFSGIPFPYRPPPLYTNGYTATVPNENHTRPLLRHPQEYPERKKRQHPPDDADHRHRPKEPPPVVAAIDLTVDQNNDKLEKEPRKHHKCQCECGKSYTSDPVTKEVIITERKSSQVPTDLFTRKTVNGALQLQKQTDVNSNDLRNRLQTKIIRQIETTKKNEVKQAPKPSPPPINPDKKVPEEKLPQLFLIKDLLAKGIHVEKKSPQNEPPARISSQLDEKKTNGTLNPQPIPITTEPNRVIVSTGHSRPLIQFEPQRKSHDYSVSNIIGTNNRRQSVDIDTISISSSSSESVRSPRSKSDRADNQIPKGKLFYCKTNNSFIRYFDDSQKKLFMDNLRADGSEVKQSDIDDPKEVIELPQSAMFCSKDSLTVEEYVAEMTLAEKYIPKDFFLFYKFVTGYQICNNNHPVSFLTFLKIYNTNGLKELYERYVSSLKSSA